MENCASLLVKEECFTVGITRCGTPDVLGKNSSFVQRNTNIFRPCDSIISKTLTPLVDGLIYY
ncbi:hypothetical protein BTN49_1795 [Candidatus Enterovibrio escicola]|uniref:Uncharacterized protein n=1 Tax=Candidatus Enterovibrio escicola TaxID=1927127 RepID=A0A2A5T344_9GAMM|nr:hypothetical protein BTN49_1795 [Candidatus Enterovibrio escacola]